MLKSSELTDFKFHTFAFSGHAPAHAGEPRQLGERSLTICADIADAMDALCAVLGIHEKGEL